MRQFCCGCRSSAFHEEGMKDGSHLCATELLPALPPVARMPQAIDTATSHLGFHRIVRQPNSPAGQ
jgi:formylglycine-generating enzyme